ncbi:MAG: MGMT family protein [Fimbriimonadales bacterium]
MSQLWFVVATIPYGKVATYGDVGRELDPPVSGLLVGKWMARAPEGVPWWRVVARDGTLVVAKRSPALGLEQRLRLEKEGVPFHGDQVEVSVARHCFEAP